MKDTIINLMNCYKDFLFNISEYTLVNEDIKNRMKSKREKVEFYSLELKYKDYSRYNPNISEYLKEHKLYKFLEKQIDNTKINELIGIGILTENSLEYFIDKENTRLIINSDNLLNEITTHKNIVREEIKKLSMLDLVRRRELLRLKANESRIKYFNAAKDTKDILVLHYKDKITVKVAGDVIKLEIKIISRTYKNEFFEFLDANNIDAIKYKVLDNKINSSKDRRLNKEIIEKYRIDDKRECLYISVLPGAFKKYKATNKKG